MRLCVLGPIEVVDNGAPVPLGGPKERTLLAALAVHAGEVVSESRLIDALWDEEPPRTATKTLQNYVLRVRKAFREHADGASETLTIETAPPGYRLHAGERAIDSAVADRLATSARAAIEARDYPRAETLLAEALACWRGPSFAEFADRPFAIAEASRLDNLRQALLEDKIDVALAVGRHHAVVAEIEALLALHPLRERLWGQLMIALYRSGRQADALRAYQRARTTLVEQLGIEPGPELRRIEQAVIDQDASLDYSPPEEAATIPGPPVAAKLPPELAAPRHPLFVGRKTEMASLLAAWERASAGGRHAVLIGGEPGIGKTTLAAELAARLHDAGAIVLYGRNEEDFGVPYQPLAEALRWYVATRSEAGVVNELGPWARALERLVPELAIQPPHPPDAPAPPDPELERQRLFDAVAASLSAISSVAPVLLIVDDLHWAAKPTLLLLRHILRPTAPARLLVVGVFRNTELGRDDPLSHTLAELRRVEGVERMTLTGLGQDEAVELVAQRAGQDLDAEGTAFARGLHAQTGGNPFFMGEILRHLVETEWVYRRDGRWTSDHRADELDVPEGVREVVGRRLSHLSEPARRALIVAAVVGTTFALELLERIPDAADTPDTLLDALDEAVAALLLVELPGRPGCYSFGHALVRHVVLAGLTAARQARLHRRVGEAIEALADCDAHLGALALHFGRAGVVDKAVGYAERAGRDALRKLAFEEAVDSFSEGVATLDAQERPDRAARADLLLALADALALTGDRSRATAAITRAAADARAVAAPELLARAAMAHADLGVAGRPDASVSELCEEALAVLGETPSALRAMVMARLSYHRALWEGRAPEARELAQQALDVARAVGNRAALHLALDVRAVTLVGSPDVEERLAVAEELAASTAEAGDTLMHASALRRCALARLELADVDGFDRDVASFGEIASRLRRRELLSQVARWQTLRALFDGRFGDAERWSAEMLAEAGDDVNPRSAHMCQMFILRRDQGRLEEARVLPEAAVNKTPGLLTFRAMIALADAELGRTAEARRELDDLAVGGFARINRDFTWTASLSTLTGLCDALEDRDRAAQLLELFRPHAGHLVVMGWGDVCPGAVDRYLAILADVCGQLDQAERLFESALALEARLGSPPSLVRTRSRFARMLLHRDGPGDRPRARELAAAAEVAARQCGMATIADDAHQLALTL